MTQIDRRQLLKRLAALGALGASGLATACATGTDDQATSPPGSPIRIGLLAPRTGGLRTIGEEIVNGFQLYLDLNRKQLGGHPVTLVTEDEGTSAQAGRVALDRLLKQDVLALTGVASSEVMLAARDIVEKAQVPLVGSNASPVSLQGVIYIWRTSFVNNEAGQALGGYLADQSFDRIAIVAMDDVAGRDQVEGFREAFGSSDPRIAADPVWTENNPEPGPSFFGQYLQRVRNINPDAVFCFFTGIAAIEFVRQFRNAGLAVPIFAPGTLTEGPVLRELGNNARSIYTAMNYSPDLDNAANRLFVSAYRRAYGAGATAYAMASYDAAAVLDKAIRLAGDTLNPQRVNLMLSKVGQIDSPRGTWQFNQPRTPQQKWYLRQVRPDGPVLANVSLSELATLG